MMDRRAFTLVELSIVLVILGLLAGGILAGQSLIRAAEVRSIVSEYNRYSTAAYAFRDKYFALPGDFATATAIWGKDNTNCSGNPGNVGTPGTCNGNGSGLVDPGTSAGATSEYGQFWKQLALAGLIEGTYSGLAGSGGIYHCTIGTDCPVSHVKNAGWGVHSVGAQAGDASDFAMTYNNTLVFGTQTAGNPPFGTSALKPEEAWNVDTKMDDGRPAYGKAIMRGAWAGTPTSGCVIGPASASDLANASYNLANPNPACAFWFLNSY